MELPSGYTSINDILAQLVTPGKLVNIMGLVKDYQAPIPTKGSGEFSYMELYIDESNMDKITNVLSPFTINR